MVKETFSEKQTGLKSEYVTTSELARLCGVTRYTIINWTKKDKIKVVKTVGGHRRIPRSEAISVLESFRISDEKKGTPLELVPRCWEFASKTGCDEKCGNCITYKEKINYCFLAVQQLGKEWIRCEGNCPDCVYFNEIFSKMKMVKNPSGKKFNITEKGIIKKKENVSNNLSYSLGRSMVGMKRRIEDIKRGFSEKRIKI